MGPLDLPASALGLSPNAHVQLTRFTAMAKASQARAEARAGIGPISGPVPNQAYSHASQTPVSFTMGEINALRALIHTFKLISRGLPVPQ